MSDHRVVVVGGGAAAAGVVSTLERAGLDGQVTVVSDEFQRPYDRPPLSKSVLTDSGVQPTWLLAPDHRGAQYVLGDPAVGLDIHTHRVALSSGRLIPYEDLVIATGVRPRRVLNGDAADRAHALRTYDDALALRDKLTAGASVVVLGASVLGTEVAASAVQRGCRVVVAAPELDLGGRLLGSTVAAMLTGVHEGHGVQRWLGRSALGVDTTPGSDVLRIRFDDGTVLDADVVVEATGSVPNTEWLQGTGVTLADGVVTDEHLRVSSGIWAAGDVCRWRDDLSGQTERRENRTNASEQALIVARNIEATRNGSPMRRMEAVPYFWTDQYGLTLHVLGRVGHDDQLEELDGDLSSGDMAAIYRDGSGRLAGAVVVGRPRVLRELRLEMVKGRAASSAAAAPGA